MQQVLQFSPMANNGKLKKISNWSDNYIGYTFSLPSGYSCPSADECLSKADKRLRTAKTPYIDALVLVQKQCINKLGINAGITSSYCGNWIEIAW